MNRELVAHYAGQWHVQPTVKRWTSGRYSELPPTFCVLECPPSAARPMWTYATCDMSQATDRFLLELHLFSSVQYEPHVELLTAVAHYHRTAKPLGLAHIVNFGRPWMEGSNCSHGLISLPYLDRPALERLECKSVEKTVQCPWLVPITDREREYAIAEGLEALEAKFEEQRFNYLDPMRPSVV